MKKTERETIVQAGRVELRKWLLAAEKHGTIYYEVTHLARSGMSRRIVLATIRMVKGKPQLWNLFPGLPETDFTEWRQRSSAVDLVAKDWGYSFKYRAFLVDGCGMDMVFALVDSLAWKGGQNTTTSAKEAVAMRGRGSYANRVRRESFS